MDRAVGPENCCCSETWGVAPGWYGIGALPLSLATQQQIVAEIEAEQALVAANRELITRFEQKIQATLARIWGEPAPSTTTPEPERESASPALA